MISKAQIKLIRSLADKSSRQERGLFVCEGRKLVEEILKSELTISSVFHTGNDFDGTTITKQEMERISHLRTPTDVLALVEIPEYRILDPNNELSIALDGVQDPGNLGTIIRLADWFGIRTIYCSIGSADCFSPKVVQATMGAISRVQIHYLDLAGLITTIDCPIYGTFLEGQNIYQEQLTATGVIVMGSEGRGISPEVAACVNRKLYIPPYPADRRGSESLNVAIATAIVCSLFRSGNQ